MTAPSKSRTGLLPVKAGRSAAPTTRMSPERSRVPPAVHAAVMIGAQVTGATSATIAWRLSPRCAVTSTCSTGGPPCSSGDGACPKLRSKRTTVVAGSLFTFSLTMGDYITPDLVSDAKFVGNVIYDNSSLGNLPLAAAYSLLPIVVMTGYLLVARRLGAFESL